MQKQAYLAYFGEKRMSIVEFVPIALQKKTNKNTSLASASLLYYIRKFKFERHTKQD
jgi:hypothetical protein